MKIMKNINQTNIISFTLTPELIARIYEEVKKAFLRKDGTPFKREKIYWIKNLIKRVAENLNLRKDIVEKAINKLIDNCYLIIDYRNEVYYRAEYLSEKRGLNKRLRAIGQKVSTRGGRVESLKDQEIRKEITQIEFWDLLCNKLFEYHNKQLDKLDNLEQEEYLKGLSELEFKIWTIIKIGGIVNPDLIMHKDFPEVWELFQKLN